MIDNSPGTTVEREAVTDVRPNGPHATARVVVRRRRMEIMASEDVETEGSARIQRRDFCWAVDFVRQRVELAAKKTAIPVRIRGALTQRTL